MEDSQDYRVISVYGFMISVPVCMICHETK